MFLTWNKYLKKNYMKRIKVKFYERRYGMAKFIKAVECPVCGEIVKDNGLSLDLTTEENVICLNSFSCESFHCKSCGTDIYVGDIDDCIEYETPEEE